MKNAIKFFGIFTVIAIIGFGFSACGNGTTDKDTSNPCAKGHSFTATIHATCAHPSVPGTCTRSGCNALKPESIIPALGHHAPDGTEATCTTAGNTGTGTCQREGCVATVNGEVIPKLGHDHGSSGYGSLVCTRDNCNHQYAVGDTGPAGGIIVYACTTGGFTVQGYGNPGDTDYFSNYTAYYLEAAPSNALVVNSSYNIFKWTRGSNNTFPIINFTTEAETKVIGAGRKNTALIIEAEQSAFPDGTYIYAALAAKNYRPPSPNDNITDWFLPSIEELQQIRTELGDTSDKIKNNFVEYLDSTVWSSTPSGIKNSVSAIPIKFSDNSRIASNKSNYHIVRAIRAF